MRTLLFLLLAGQLLIPDVSCALTVCNPAGQTEEGVYIDAVLEQSGGLKVGFPRAERETMTPGNDGLEDFNELFLARGWGDGLPLIPPTPERVEAMVAGYDLPGDFPIATLAPMEGVATVEKIAVNAVMAGCEPRHMPLLVAAVEAVSQPEFDLRGMSTTTNPDAVLTAVESRSSSPVLFRVRQWDSQGWGLTSTPSSSSARDRSPAVVRRVLTIPVTGGRPLLAASRAAVSSVPRSISISWTSHTGWEYRVDR